MEPTANRSTDNKKSCDLLTLRSENFEERIRRLEGEVFNQGSPMTAYEKLSQQVQDNESKIEELLTMIEQEVKNYEKADLNLKQSLLVKILS